MARPRRRQEEHEEHENHERWLVSYADMMTLLMVLFIVMFAISQVDERRFDQLKDGMAAGFGATASPFEGSQATMDGEGTEALKEIAPNIESQQVQDIGVPTKSAREAVHQEQEDAAQAAARHEVDRLERLRRQVERALARQGLRDDVSITLDSRGLVISLVSRHIVFRANEATLTPRGHQVLRVLTPVVRDLPNPIELDGHTNQVKVKPKYYPTDWELSAARAVNVLRSLAADGVPASRMRAVAFGHTRPLRDPALPGAAALNKRVDLVVTSTAPERSRALIPVVLRERRVADRHQVRARPPVGPSRPSSPIRHRGAHR